MFRLNYIVIYLSFIVGMTLLILPLPAWARIYRPDWVALILIYWTIALPKNLGLWSSFTIGLFVDSLIGTLLGQHALGLVLINYVNLNFYLRIRVLSRFQQSLYVFVLLLVSQFIVFWLDGVMELAMLIDDVFSSPFVGALMWPFVFFVLRYIRRKAMLS